MFRKLGKSKIAFVLAILFGISLFFFRGGSRYSNLLNSDNIIANVSNTSISTTKFNRTLQMNINNFSQMIGQRISKEQIIGFQIHSLALGALINDAVFENEFDNQDFKIDETVIAKKTKERLPSIYDENNKLNKESLNKFLLDQNLKIEDIVQIIDYETRNQFFNDAFFNISYPKNYSNKIYNYENHKRKINKIVIPLNKINIDKKIESLSNDLKKIINEFYENNLDNYMSLEKRDVDYLIKPTISIMFA